MDTALELGRYLIDNGYTEGDIKITWNEVIGTLKNIMIEKRMIEKLMKDVSLDFYISNNKIHFRKQFKSNPSEKVFINLN